MNALYNPKPKRRLNDRNSRTAPSAPNIFMPKCIKSSQAKSFDMIWRLIRVGIAITLGFFFLLEISSIASASKSVTKLFMLGGVTSLFITVILAMIRVIIGLFLIWRKEERRHPKNVIVVSACYIFYIILSAIFIYEMCRRLL